MEVILQIETPGEDLDYFDIYTNFDDFTEKINITPYSKAELLLGVTITVPEGATIVRAQALNVCQTYAETTLFSAFIMEFSMGTDEQLIIPLQQVEGHNFVIDWGDGSPTSTITSYTDEEALTHTYTASNLYRVSIEGTCKGIYFNNGGNKSNLTRIISWGNVGFTSFYCAFLGCDNLYSLPSGPITGAHFVTSYDITFAGCNSLIEIPQHLFDESPNVANNGFKSTFQGCTSISEIPENLFINNIRVSKCGFMGTFYGCESLISIPEHLFDTNTLVNQHGFCETFCGCILLENIPPDLFKYNTLVSAVGFMYTFKGCVSLTYIPPGLFTENKLVSNSAFLGTFEDCNSLETIPPDLFKYNTLVSNSGFKSTFAGCGSLINIPDDLFRYNIEVSTDGFNRTFTFCTNLPSVPDNLFKYNTKVNGEGFYQTFGNCHKLQLNQWIFYAYGEQATRFLNNNISFEECFDRLLFTGTPGTAPDLWNCEFGTGAVTKKDCYDGAGNDEESLSNYNDIPADWK